MNRQTQTAGNRQVAVLMYLSNAWGGGSESHVYWLTLALLDRGARVTLAVQSRFASDPGRRSALVAAGVEFLWLPQLRGPRKAAALARLIFLYWRLRGRRFDVVLAHGNGSTNYHLRHFARPTGRFVWHDHFFGAQFSGVIPDYFEQPVLGVFPEGLRRSVMAADVVVVGSEAGANNLRTLQGCRSEISVAPPLAAVAPMNAVNRAYNRDSVLRLGLFAFALDHRKGVPQLLNLWDTVHAGPCELHLWGNDTRNELEERSRRLGLRNVYFHGAFQPSDLPQLMEATDLGLVLSIHEGYPLSAWEFMAFGVPFVITPAGAAVEFTTNNTDSELADFSPQGVRAAIEKLAERVRSGQTSRRRLQELQRSKFSFESAIERHLSYCLPGSITNAGQMLQSFEDSWVSAAVESGVNRNRAGVDLGEIC